MAPTPQERRADTVAVPKSTVKAAAWVASTLAMGISVVLWNVVVDNVRLNERVKQLEDFGPNSGERFTAKQGEEIRRWMLELQKDLNNHKGLGAHTFADRRLTRLESCCEKIEDNCFRNKSH